jgi:NAD(P)-dependent dehydrogenase (short-subunit alcohol dehydrogenase family)
VHHLLPETVTLDQEAIPHAAIPVKPVTLEVHDEAAAKAAVRFAVDTFGWLDVLVNNAGYGQIAPFEQ